MLLQLRVKQVCMDLLHLPVCSVTDTPPMLLVCMNQSSRSHAHFVENKVLAVNVLSTTA